MSDESVPAVETTAPEGAAPPEPAPPAEPKAPPSSLEERLAKAEASAARRREQATREARARKELEEKLGATSKEVELTRAEVNKIKALRERAADGDDDAITELLGFDFDTLTRLKLQPDETRQTLKAKRGQTELEKQLEELRQWKQQQEQREQYAAIEQERAAFVQTAEGLVDELPDLGALDRESLLALGSTLAPAFFQQHGRPPTFRELAREVATYVQPYHQRIYEVYSKRQASKPTTPAPPKGAGPRTITGSSASTSAAETRTLTPEERREMAIRKAKELIGGS